MSQLPLSRQQAPLFGVKEEDHHRLVRPADRTWSSVERLRGGIRPGTRRAGRTRRDLPAPGVAHRGRDPRRPQPCDELSCTGRWRDSHWLPGVGFSGMRFTCTSFLPTAGQQPPSRSARHGWSLTSRISAYSMDTRRPVARRSRRRPRAPRRPSSVGSPARARRADRHRARAATPQASRAVFVGQPVDRRHQSDRGHGDVPLGHAQALRRRLGEPADRRDAPACSSPAARPCP